MMLEYFYVSHLP